jgi:hypothetical protein
MLAGDVGLLPVFFDLDEEFFLPIFDGDRGFFKV